MGNGTQFRVAGAASVVWGREAGGARPRRPSPGPGSRLCPWDAREPWKSIEQGRGRSALGPGGDGQKWETGGWEAREQAGMRAQGKRTRPELGP